MRSRTCLPAIVAAVVAAIPASLTAQGAPSSSPTGVVWEYGTFGHHYGAAKRWVGPDGKMIESSKLPEFLTALGATPAEIPAKYDSEERWHAVIFNLLGRQGWEAVGCQLMDRSRDYYYVCVFKRPVVASPSAGNR